MKVKNGHGFSIQASEWCSAQHLHNPTPFQQSALRELSLFMLSTEVGGRIFETNENFYYLKPQFEMLR